MPIAALYEQGRIHHVGPFPDLEDQLCAALPEGADGPDDRLDALVWAFTELGLAGVEWDIWEHAFARGLWPCRGCGQFYGWDPRRPCPRCWLAAPETYDGPAPRPDGMTPIFEPPPAPSAWIFRMRRS